MPRRRRDQAQARPPKERNNHPQRSLWSKWLKRWKRSDQIQALILLILAATACVYIVTCNLNKSALNQSQLAARPFIDVVNPPA